MDLSEFRSALDSIHPGVTRALLPWALRHPRRAAKLVRLARVYGACRPVRDRAIQRGVRVPPFLVLSVTAKCNLRCGGCFAGAIGTTHGSQPGGGLPIEDWRSIIQQACELGVFGFVLAGGEPFLLPGLANLCLEFPDRLFLIFTNGTSIPAQDFSRIARASNTIPCVSLEGGREETDLRRGAGVFDRAMDALRRLDAEGALAGFSATISRLNFRYWMRPENLNALIEHGARVGFFIEHIPTAAHDTALMLAPQERAAFRARVLEYRAEKPILLVHSPADEEAAGGCVSAGRSFAHVTPAGDVTACPVSNLATHNLRTSSLEQALASPLFALIRNSQHLLETEGAPCALFTHARELETLAEGTGAYRTGTVPAASAGAPTTLSGLAGPPC